MTEHTCAHCGNTFREEPRLRPPWSKAPERRVRFCVRCDYLVNRNLPKVLCATQGMTTQEIADAAREACRNSLRNTAVGAWLAVCLERMEAACSTARGKEAGRC